MRDGVINILKAPGMTSSDAVYDVRRALGIKRVGHTGTLDPGACGVLPICVGRATRLFDYLVEKEKEYIAEVTFGTATDTQDAYGHVINTDKSAVTEETLSSAFSHFLGDIEQTAPMYSAVSVGGQRLYKLARQGIEVERKKRQVNIRSIDILRKVSDNVYLLKICCSKGTYIRTLCADIAEHMGTCGYVSFLLRSRSGIFTLDNAVSIQELSRVCEQGRADELILPADEAIINIPRVDFTDDARARKMLVNGAGVRCAGDGTVRVYCDGEFIGIGECADGSLHIKVQFCND